MYWGMDYGVVWRGISGCNPKVPACVSVSKLGRTCRSTSPESAMLREVRLASESEELAKLRRDEEAWTTHRGKAANGRGNAQAPRNTAAQPPVAVQWGRQPSPPAPPPARPQVGTLPSACSQQPYQFQGALETEAVRFISFESQGTEPDALQPRCSTRMACNHISVHVPS